MAIQIASGLEALESYREIEVLNSRFCFYLDRCMNDELLDLFTEDAFYQHGDRISHGREEIGSVFAARVSEAPRTARHVQTGLLINLGTDKRATGTSCCVTYAANASPPIVGTEPLLVADFYDEYEKGDDGQWRISARDIKRVFVAPGNTGPVGTQASAGEGA
jgi:hypothetical protein